MLCIPIVVQYCVDKGPPSQLAQLGFSKAARTAGEPQEIYLWASFVKVVPGQIRY